MITLAAVTLWCAGCRAERLFEQPPCADGHGSDCPELACVHCGEALLGPSTLLEVADPPQSARRAG
jgi:hypothetical protein